MRLRIEQPTPEFRIPRLAIVAGAILAVLGLAAASLATTQGPVICPFRALTGLSCPSCGLLRGAAAILAGRPGLAFAINPLAAIFLLAVTPAAAVLWLVRLWRGVVLRVELARGERMAAWAVLLTAVCINWVYVLATHP